MTRGPSTDHPSIGAEVAPGGVASWAPRVTGIVSRQRDLYRRLDDLSAAQSDLIRLGKTDDLLRILGERQHLIEALDALNREMAPFVERWEHLSKSLEPSVRESLEESINEVGRLVEAISQRDERDRRDLEIQKSVVSRELGDVGRARGAMAAYSSAGREVEPRYQDREG